MTTNETLDTLNQDQCPDCGIFGMELGPRGGLSRNVFCKGCGSGFNVAPWRFDQPPHDFVFVERIRERTR
jgi:hypothetical protein